MLSLVDGYRRGSGRGLLWIVGEGYFRLRGREGMGLGDVKMMGMVGVFLGVKRTLLTILLGSLLGSVIGIVVIATSARAATTSFPLALFSAPGRCSWCSSARPFSVGIRRFCRPINA